ncbi:MAG: hypothetical protein HOJ25_00385 [Candidatus Magasanikbacteria bacterium]|jgi:hypothetical protein|nr:hypothetical protein [Candidatus Magasanikbacteria bacterium]MBT5819952.1 hypothetical protein [Candidatus Magasanikbacteria bacterium]MBT6294134.1 hypothetical protein [Candidatus Magasanikbacteria bacterium]
MSDIFTEEELFLNSSLIPFFRKEKDAAALCWFERNHYKVLSEWIPLSNMFCQAASASVMTRLPLFLFNDKELLGQFIHFSLLFSTHVREINPITVFSSFERKSDLEGHNKLKVELRRIEYFMSHPVFQNKGSPNVLVRNKESCSIRGLPVSCKKDLSRDPRWLLIDKMQDVVVGSGLYKKILAAQFLFQIPKRRLDDFPIRSVFLEHIGMCIFVHASIFSCLHNIPVYEEVLRRHRVLLVYFCQDIVDFFEQRKSLDELSMAQELLKYLDDFFFHRYFNNVFCEEGSDSMYREAFDYARQ